jgi:hypothetical protein
MGRCLPLSIQVFCLTLLAVITAHALKQRDTHIPRYLHTLHVLQIRAK